MKQQDLFDAMHTGASDPHQTVRNYDLGNGLPLVGLLNNPWYPPYIQDFPHIHNCMEIGICIYGSGSLIIDDQSWHFRADSVVIVPKGVMHMQLNEGTPLTHWHYILVNETAWLETLPTSLRKEGRELLEGVRNGIYFAPDRKTTEMRAIANALFHRYTLCQTLEDLELNAGLNLLMAQLSLVSLEAAENVPALVKDRKGIEPALQYVSRNYHQEIRMDQMAAACAMSESYFRKVFQSVMGVPPLEYVNRYRINRSVQLLSMTNETILTIAGMTGFSSIATYNRNFKRYVGQSPAQWRKYAGK